MQKVFGGAITLQKRVLSTCLEVTRRARKALPAQAAIEITNSTPQPLGAGGGAAPGADKAHGTNEQYGRARELHRGNVRPRTVAKAWHANTNFVAAQLLLT